MNKAIAIISGGMGAIGQACATALAAKGFRVVLFYHTTPKSDVDAFLSTLGDGHAGVAVDVTDEAHVREAVAQIAGTGDLQVVLHTPADTIKRKTVAEMTGEDFRSQFEATVFGAFNLFSAALPRMDAGLIVGITTEFINPGHATSRMPGYIAAKYALQGLLREIATEGKARGIRANAIAPDFMDTTFSSDLPRRFFEWQAQKDPRGRLTTPDEVAQRLRFLLSDEGSSVTGVSLSVVSADSRPL